MPRKLRLPKTRVPQRRADDVLVYAAMHGELPPRDRRDEYSGSTFEVFNKFLYVNPSREYVTEREREKVDIARGLWAEVRDLVLDLWIADRPGSRPWAWWMFDAPRLRLASGGETLEPLRKVAGSGTPIYMDAYQLAKPPVAVTAFDDIDEADPPQVESEAAYLKRHELLVPGELRRLTDEDFAPIVLDDEDEEGSAA